MIAGCGEGSSPPPNDSQVKAESVAALKKLGAYIRRNEQGEVVEINLMRTQITDEGLVHLKALTRLQDLSFGRNKITDAGVADLQKALPNCKIVK